MTGPVLEVVVILLGVAAVAMLVSGRLSQEMAGISLLVLLMAIGAISPPEALAVIVDPVIVTIGSLYVMGHALQASGALNPLAKWMVGSGRGSRWSLRGRIVLFFLAIVVLSAGINNTAVVIIFIPVTLELARRSGIPATRLLMPISFAAMLGGTMTLVGTSTNLLVADAYGEIGAGSMPFFSFLVPGLALAVVGGAWLALVGRHHLPVRHVRERLLTEGYNVSRFLVMFRIGAGAALDGVHLGSVGLVAEDEVEVLEVYHGETRTRRVLEVDVAPGPGAALRAGDEILLRVTPDKVALLCDRYGLRVVPLEAELGQTEEEGMGIAQALLIPGSELVGKTLEEVGFSGRYGVSALSVRHGTEEVEVVKGYRLRMGDTVLVHGPESRLTGMGDLRSEFLLVQKAPYRFARRRHALVAIAAIVAFIGLVVLAIPTYQAGILVVGGLILLNTVKLDEAFRAIDHKVLALIIGFLALGTALESLGTFGRLQEGSAGLVVGLGPVVTLFLLYAVVAVVTSFLSNAATAVLFLPIALQAAESLGVADPLPYALAVALAASASFATPIGYQTNTLVYSVGKYSFKDFARVGIPMTLITGAAACLAILYLTPAGRMLLETPAA